MRHSWYVGTALVFWVSACGIPNGELSISGSSNSDSGSFSAQVQIAGPTTLTNIQCAAYTASVISSDGSGPQIQTSTLALQLNSNVHLAGVSNFGGSAAQFYQDSTCETPVENESIGAAIQAGAASTTFYVMSPVGFSFSLSAGPGCNGPCSNSSGIGWSNDFNVTVALDSTWPWATIAQLAGSPAPRGDQDSATLGANVRFNEPVAVAADGVATGYLYVADSRNQLIRRISKANGTSTTFAGGGNGQGGSNDGVGTGARFNNLSSLVIVGGVLYVADDRQIRSVTLAASGSTPAATVTTIANKSDMSGYANGAAGQALFQSISGIAVSGSSLFISDGGNQMIRLLNLTTLTVSTIAGTQGGSGQNDSLSGSSATFESPGPLAMMTVVSGTFVVVNDNGALRMVQSVSPYGVVTPGGTVCPAGSGSPQAIAGGGVSGSLAVVCGSTLVGVQFSGGAFSSSAIAGSGTFGSYDGGSALMSTFTNSVEGLVIDNTATPPILYAADAEAQNIRRITMNAAALGAASAVATLSGPGDLLRSQDGTGTGAFFDGISSLTYANGVLYAVESATDNLREINPSNGQVTTLGNYPGIGAMAIDAGIYVFWEDRTGGETIVRSAIGSSTAQAISTFNIGRVGGITAPSGFPYYTDSENNAVYFAAFALGATLNTLVAGSAGESGNQDGTGAEALFESPGALTVLGNYLYVLDVGNNEIRAIDVGVPAPFPVTTVAGNRSNGFGQSADGLGQLATLDLSQQSSLTSDGARYLYFSESNGSILRRYDTISQMVTTVAGLQNAPLDINGLVSAALLSEPGGIAFGGGNLYFSNNFNVRALEP